jgi:hypothetical protein
MMSKTQLKLANRLIALMADAGISDVYGFKVM